MLAQPSISSQLVDNLNASIHLRALLTDLFLIDEVFKAHRGRQAGRLVGQAARPRPAYLRHPADPAFLPMSAARSSDRPSLRRSGVRARSCGRRAPSSRRAKGMDAWIDTYHAVRRLTREGTFVFLTDSAVGAEEEDNLRHLVTNLGTDVPRERIVPFLTSKHSLEYCLSYAERAHQSGFPALVVLGGDKSVGPPRSVEHAWQLRALLRSRDHTLALGGWANPHGDAGAAGRLSRLRRIFTRSSI